MIKELQTAAKTATGKAIIATSVAATELLAGVGLIAVTSPRAQAQAPSTIEAVVDYNDGAENAGFSYDKIVINYDSSNGASGALGLPGLACSGFFGVGSGSTAAEQTGITLKTKDGSNTIPQSNGSPTNYARFTCVTNPAFVSTAATPNVAKWVPSPAVAAHDTSGPLATDKFAVVTFYQNGIATGQRTNVSYDWTFGGVTAYFANLAQTPATDASKTFVSIIAVDLTRDGWVTPVNGNQIDEVPYKAGSSSGSNGASASGTGSCTTSSTSSSSSTGGGTTTTTTTTTCTGTGTGTGNGGGEASLRLPPGFGPVPVEVKRRQQAAPALQAA